MKICFLLLALAVGLPGADGDLKKKAAEYLEAAAGMVGAGSSEFQPGALLQLGIVEGSRDKARAKELIEQALAASAVLPTSSSARVREEFQAMAVRELVKVDLEAAIEAMGMLTPLPADEDDPRAGAVEAIVGRLVAGQEVDRAGEVIGRYGMAGAFPYEAMPGLLKALPEEDPRRDLWFAQTLGAFTQSPNLAAMERLVRQFRPGRKGGMGAQTFETAVRAMVRAALDGRGLGRTSMTMTTAKGTVHLTDPQEVALFSLADLALGVDPDLLERMKGERAELRAALEQFPRGRATMDVNGEAVTTLGTIEPGQDAAAARARMQRLAVETMKFQEVMTYLRSDPERAIAAARQIPTARLAVRSYGTIAMNQDAKEPGAMLSVVRKCAAALGELKDEGARASGWATLANAAQRAKDEGLAREYLLKGLEDARRLYETDTDAREPNVAPRPLWPSAVVFRAIFYRAAHLLGGEAETFLERIPDAEIATLARIEMAAAWLGVPATPGTPRFMRPAKR
jgi:hypothetical protein